MTWLEILWMHTGGGGGHLDLRKAASQSGIVNFSLETTIFYLFRDSLIFSLLRHLFPLPSQCSLYSILPFATNKTTFNTAALFSPLDHELHHIILSGLQQQNSSLHSSFLVYCFETPVVVKRYPANSRIDLNSS